VAPEAAAPDYRKYLDPRVLSRISGLEVRARLIVEGFFSGRHRSPYRGLSIEFADHRAYTQGDDIRHIDWKVYGRTDKYYIKEYEQETNLNMVLVVDRSESMSYRSTPHILTKYEYAASLAAAMAYLTLQQQDSVGLALFDEDIRQFLRPANNAHHWRAIIQGLDGGTGQSKTSLDRVLGELVERLTQRTLIVLISDLFDDAYVVLRGFQHIRFRHHELIVWNLWDPAELSFPFTGPTLFDGLEASGRVHVEPRSVATRYREEVERFRTRLRAGCGRMQAEFTSFNTSAPLDIALSGYLATRSARLRQRSARVMGRG